MKLLLVAAPVALAAPTAKPVQSGKIDIVDKEPIGVEYQKVDKIVATGVDDDRIKIHIEDVRPPLSHRIASIFTTPFQWLAAATAINNAKLACFGDGVRQSPSLEFHQGPAVSKFSTTSDGEVDMDQAREYAETRELSSAHGEDDVARDLGGLNVLHDSGDEWVPFGAGRSLIGKIEHGVESIGAHLTGSSGVTPPHWEPAPYGPPTDYRALADAVYYHGNMAAQSHIDKANLKIKYEVLESRIFAGHIFKRLVHQEWNVMLVKQTHHSLEGPNYIVAFEGTDAPGDWVADMMDKFILPHALLADMNAQIANWMTQHDISRIAAFVGHSAGAMFVKYSYEGQDLARIGNPYLITFNGFDPRPQQGERQIDLRITGDAVSACFGARNPITLCSIEPHMGVVGSHHLASFDLVDVTWQLLDQTDRYGFPRDARDIRQTAAFRRCNAGILDPSTGKGHLNMVGSSVTAASKTRDTQEQSGSEQEEEKSSGSILHSLFGSDEPQTVAKFAEYDHGQSTALENMKDVSVEGKHTFLNFFGKMDGQENFVDYNPYDPDRAEDDEEPYRATCWGAVRYGL